MAFTENVVRVSVVRLLEDPISVADNTIDCRPRGLMKKEAGEPGMAVLFGPYAL